MDATSCNGPCHGNGYCSFANGGALCTCNTPAFNASADCGQCVTGYALCIATHLAAHVDR
jgi:hypothetical protein